MSSLSLTVERRAVTLDFQGRLITLGPFVGPAQGEANTAANVGGGAGVFRDKAGNTLNLRSVVGAGGLVATENANEIEIDGSGVGHLPWLEDEYTPTAGQITFIITQPPADLVSMKFYVNGILYDDDGDYTVSGATVTWLGTNFVMQTTDKVHISYQ